MKDLRKSFGVSDKKPKVNFSPLKWLNKNKNYFIISLCLFIILNVIFNPGGVSNFISSWLSEFLNNWKV